MNHFDIPSELKKLPHLTGVYIMKDENGGIIYVGKANNLHNRVRNYFQASNPDIKARRLAKRVSYFEYVITDNENEAFILENNLIKLHRPKFNIRLKDEKGYPYIKITKERLPRILFSHQRGKDKAKYYGPFISRSHVRELLELLHRLWPLRHCSKKFPRDFDKDRPCLYYHIGQCKAPCNRLLDEDTYNRYVQEAERFIQGKTDGVAERLTKEMAELAEAMEFEKAAELRDTINALHTLTEKQKVETGGDDRDIIALARKDDEALVQIFFMRDGKLSGREHYIMSTAPNISAEEKNQLAKTGTDFNDSNTEIADTETTDIALVSPDIESDAAEAAQSSSDGEILSAFIKQFYSEAAVIPKELTLVSAPAEQDAIAVWLSGLSGRQVTIHIPKKGEKHGMIKLAQTNAELTMSQFGSHIKKETERNQMALQEISAAIGLDSPLTRIEAYDISNIQGYESVGSMIVFEHGKAKNSDYRKFRLKAVIGPDDYAGMEEIITRRLARYCASHESFAKLPDIIFVDGGKGQITAAKKALQALNLYIPICGMVKDDRHRTRGLLYEGTEATLPRSGEGFKLVTRIQDEVHRFALEYHKKLRADTQVRSVLDDIEGIGKTRRKELLKHFKNIEAIRTASIDDLTNAPAMNKRTAEAVYNFFNPIINALQSNTPEQNKEDSSN